MVAIVLASGEGRAEDLGESWRMADTLGAQGIPNGVDPFEEAVTAVVDPNALFLADDAGAEQRLVAIGMSEQMRILFVVHIERGQRDRIIRARVATRAEETLYEQGS